MMSSDRNFVVVWASAMCKLSVYISFSCRLCGTEVTRGWNGYQNKSQHIQTDHVEENSPAAPAETCLLYTSDAADES